MISRNLLVSYRKKNDTTLVAVFSVLSVYNVLKVHSVFKNYCSNVRAKC